MSSAGCLAQIVAVGGAPPRRVCPSGRATTGNFRPFSSQMVLSSHACMNARRSGSFLCMAEAGERGGSNNLNVNGKPPTSPAAWQVMREVLEESGIKYMAPQEVEPAQERGMVIIDIRPEGDYDEYHIPGSINVPFYRLIDGWTPKQAMRRVAYAFFGVAKGTEYNPDFVKDAGALVDSEEGALLVCNLGGVKDEEGTTKAQTRSLMAAYELANAGYKNLATLKGGFTNWIESDRDVCSNVYDMGGEE